MGVLVLVQSYPSENNKYAMNYVHTRNLEYVKNGVNVDVLSFSANKSYEYEGITVYTKEEYVQKKQNQSIDLAISHAPNLRNHIRFLRQHDNKIKNILMFIHGHEVMKMSKYYPRSYSFVKSSTMKQKVRDLYDVYKLQTLKKFITNKFAENKLEFIFVSNWMKDVFLENIPIDPAVLDKNSYVIPNSMNTVFLEKKYDLKDAKADFVTIRPLDNSKYAIDLVVELARKHPDLSFHIYGKGDYFKYNDKPKNLEVFQEFFSPNALADLFNHYRCALLPTRLDAQGVMMCEAATYGIPLVTSDLPICLEMLDSFENVFFFNNNELNIDLNEVLNKIKLQQEINKEKFSSLNTVQKEIEVIKSYNV